MYVYIETEIGVYSVGFYDPNGKFITESVHAHCRLARKRVHYLNGG